MKKVKKQSSFDLLVQVHKSFCKARKIKYNSKNMVKDLAWNCFEVSTRLAEILNQEGIKARSVYGFYHGTCVGKFAPFYRHGWTVVNDKEVWDSTRWVFEGAAPYLFKGKLADHPEYDEGMRLVKNMNRSPFPKSIPSPDADNPTLSFKWTKKTHFFLQNLFDGYSPKELSKRQAMWLANYDFLALGDYIDEIYQALISAKLSSFIPMDNMNWWKNKVKDNESLT
jgi:hypothetical protein